jgi:hypothetical protein
MAWTSNGVDSNGGMTQLAPATQAFRNNHFSLVFPNESQGGRLRTGVVEIMNDEDVREVDKSFTLYPNPANDFLHIDQTGMFDVEIFSIQGNRIFKTNAVNSLSVDVKNYIRGMYVVRIRHMNGLTMKKFVKE